MTEGRTAASARGLFEGLWSIRRDIFDFDSQWAGRFEGQGRFSPDGAGLSYREEGWLRFAGLSEVRATRAYRYRFPEPERVEVQFEDGRFFHDFLLGETAEAEHLCDADLYGVRYVFDWPDHWRAEWRVEGPRKDYRMVTLYQRIAASGNGR